MMPPNNGQSLIYNIKTYITMALIFTESFLLSYVIMNYIKQEKYFTPDYIYPLQIMGTMILLGWTIALSIGTWRDRSKYIIIPLPISAGIATLFWSLSVYYALLCFVASFIIISFTLHTSIKFMELFIKFEPGYILRYVINGIFLSFSIYATLVSYCLYQQKLNINVGKSVSGIIGQSVDNLVKEQLKKEVDNKLKLEGINIVSPEMIKALENMGIYVNNEESSHVLLDELEFNTKAIIETQVNRIVRPYQSYINPFISFIVFSILQLYSAIAAWIVRVTAGLIYTFGVFSKIIRIEKVQVEKEVVRF